MKRILTAEQMKRCDSYTINEIGVLSRELMGRAATAAFDAIMQGDFDLTHVLCICGTGNNGGDGLAVAKMLSDAGVFTEYYVCGDESRMTDECRYRLDVLRGIDIPEKKTLDLAGVTLIVDAVLGIGLSGDVRGEAESVIKAVTDSGISTVALDIPSGINSDTGAVMGCAVKAELTVSFARLKPGHLLYPGRTYCGKTLTAEIGIGETAIENDDLRVYSAEIADIAEILPKRSPDSHKGTYGRVLTVAGSAGMCGASYFSALASYRSGAGLVEVFTVPENLPVIQTTLPEAIVTSCSGDGAQLLRERIKFASAVVAGPGLGQSTRTVRFIEEVLGANKPVLIDADGLNILSLSDDLKERLKERKHYTVITPHMGEMARLTGKSIAEIKADPIGCARSFSDEYGVTVVLKDSATVIATDSVVNINTTGNSALAKGGSGDVLSGIIGAFLAAGKDPHTAATSGVYIHGLAGQIASEMNSEYSVLASDTANSIGRVFLELTKE